MIDKTVPIPLYYQLYNEIKTMIQDGDYTPGEKLPTEAWLMEHYGVSRVTIRKAISELISNGYAENRRGKGTFVASPKTMFSLDNMTSLHRMLNSLDIEPSSRILEDLLVPASPELSAIFSVPAQEQLHMIHRIRMADGVPIADQIIYLQDRLCPNLDVELLVHRSLYEILETEYHIVPERSFQVFNAKMSSKEDIQNLQLPKKSPLLTITATVYASGNQVVEHSINNYVPDRYGYSITLQ